MLPIAFFIVKWGQSWQTLAKCLKKCSKTIKICLFGSTQNFDPVFRLYDLLVCRWVEGTQVGSKHHIFTCRAENGISGSRYSSNLARSESHRKSLKTAKNAFFGLLYWFYWSCMVKIIAIYVWNEFQEVLAQKVLMKKKIQFSPPKNHDFSKKNLKQPKIHFFELRNPVGWVPHVVLALNQLLRPKNGGWKKCTGNV